MKILLIIRHAKSSWDSINTPDIDRPLNDRGKKDAPAMARKLIKAGIQVDRLISSPARRARNTAELFAREFDVKGSDIVILNELYHAQPGTFQQVVANLDDLQLVLGELEDRGHLPLRLSLPDQSAVAARAQSQ